MNSISEASARKTTYASPSIVRRREKMLSETWKLISEHGADGFTIPELCRRAGVSQGTFHNAFGTKENVIGLAVVEYATTVVGALRIYDDDTVGGRLERLVRVNTNILPNKRYISAVMKIYWSNSLGARAIDDFTRLNLQAFLGKLERRQAILPGIDVRELAASMTLNYYALLTSWVADAIRGEDLSRRVAQDTLVFLAGSTRGGVSREVRAWQAEVAQQGPRWHELVRVAAEQTVSVNIS